MIIDAHTHCFPDAIASHAIGSLVKNSGLTPYTDGTIKDTLAKLDEKGIDVAVVLNIATRPNQDSKINNFAIMANSERLIHFGSINPFSDGISDEMKRLKNNGIKGVKLHPLYQNFNVNCAEADAIYRNACDLDLIVAFHTGWDIAFPEMQNAHPTKLADVLNRFPSMRVQLAHFGGMMKWDSVEECIAGRNVYMDMAACARFMKPEQAKRIIDKHGVDKIMFATDCPWENWSNTFEFVEQLSLSSEERELIMWKNAARLLQL